jgi:hypothetical protein
MKSKWGKLKIEIENMIRELLIFQDKEIAEKFGDGDVLIAQIGAKRIRTEQRDYEIHVLDEGEDLKLFDQTAENLIILRELKEKLEKKLNLLKSSQEFDNLKKLVRDIFIPKREII